MLIASLLPLLGGALLPVLRLKSRKLRTIWVEGVELLTSLCVLRLILRGAADVSVIAFSREFVLTFGLDGMGRLFLGLMAFLWPLAALYASEYMQHEEREDSFFAFYTMTYGVMILYCCARNFFTLYIIFECITLVTLPLVWHKKDAVSIRAARSYIRYSIGCAAFAFAAMILLSKYGFGNFRSGGIFFEDIPEWVPGAAFLATFFGFGVKAAVFPLSAWLPRACAAPTPVTALLHAVAVVNAGVFAVLRMIYDLFGTRLLYGSWAQTVALIFSILTILFGAVMAVREKHVKRKLAYSTVSNLGYMLLGASLMSPAGQLGAMMHMVCHSLMKITLFFCIGAVMVQTGRTQMRQMHGLARRMPVVFAVFAFAAIALMGIPPLCGFVSKYYLATAALEMGSFWGIAGVTALLISSVLTAIYSLSVILPAFFLPLEEDGMEVYEKCDPGVRMLLPLALLVCAVLLLGAYSQPLADALRTIAGM